MKMLALIIDDPDVANSTRLLLEYQGHRPIIVHESPSEALTSAHLASSTIAVCHLAKPGEAFKFAKSLYCLFPSLPLIVVACDLHTLKQFAKAPPNVVVVLECPYRPDTLLDMVKLHTKP